MFRVRLQYLDRRKIFFNQCADGFLIGLISVFHGDIEIDERCQMLAERFGHTFCHEEIESRNCLSAMLLILIRLENNSSNVA